jgi:hypothetical protein
MLLTNVEFTLKQYTVVRVFRVTTALPVATSYHLGKLFRTQHHQSPLNRLGAWR